MSPINYTIDSHNISIPMNQMMKYIPLGTHRGQGSPLADQAYEHILTKIVFPEEGNTAIQYGGKITESVLARVLGISNGPVREAIFRLRQEGWIATRGNRGSFLVDFTDPEIGREIYRFRLSFETGAFYTLAATATDSQLQELGVILDKILRALADSDVASFREMDIRFHLQVMEFAGGPSFMYLFRSKLLQWYAMAFHVLMKSMGQERYSQNLEAPGASSHKDLYEALVSRNSQRAAEMISRHYKYIAQLLGLDDSKSAVVA